jgi:hypothetical protein
MDRPQRVGEHTDHAAAALSAEGTACSLADRGRARVRERPARSRLRARWLIIVGVNTSGTRVVLADDDVLPPAGMAGLLERSGFEVVGQCGDASELVALVS